MLNGVLYVLTLLILEVPNTYVNIVSEKLYHGITHRAVTTGRRVRVSLTERVRRRGHCSLILLTL